MRILFRSFVLFHDDVVREKILLLPRSLSQEEPIVEILSPGPCSFTLIENCSPFLLPTLDDV